jgi:hypothetical protein
MFCVFLFKSPNITGSCGNFQRNGEASNIGALSRDTISVNYGIGNQAGVVGGIFLNATNSNAIYGKSTTVQPSARYALMIIRA